MGKQRHRKVKFMITQLVSGRARIHPSQFGARVYILTTKQTVYLEVISKKAGGAGFPKEQGKRSWSGT